MWREQVVEEKWRQLYLNNNEKNHIKGIIHERKVAKRSSIKAEVFYFVENTVKRMRRQETECKKMQMRYVIKDLSRIYKELIKLINKKLNNLILKKWANALKDTFQENMKRW